MAKNNEIVTGIGVLRYPNLNEPRDYEGDQKFKYDTKFVASGATAEDLKAQIEGYCMGLLGKPHAKIRHPLWKDEVDDDGNESTVFSFKVAASGRSRSGKEYSRKPTFLRADGSPYDMEEPQIGSGTRARVALEVYAWPKEKPTGLSLQPRAVKIVELVEPRRRDADYYAGLMDGDETGAKAAPRTATPTRGDDF